MSRDVDSNRQSTLDSAIHANVVLLVLLGATSILAPAWFLRGFGVADAPFAVLGVARVYSVLALALASLLWTARHWLATPAGRSGVRGLAIAYGAGTAILLMQQWSVWYGRSGLALLLSCLALTVSYTLALRPLRESQGVA
jgi:hypothetical protein